MTKESDGRPGTFADLQQQHGGLTRLEVVLPDAWDPRQQIDCDCWRLSRALLPDESLPDHVCRETMEETARDWASRALETLVPAIPGGVRFHGEGNQVYCVELVSVDPEDDPAWPLQVDDGYVGLVVQQWAQEKPSKMLANQLLTLPAWSHVLDKFKTLVGPAVADALDWGDVDLSRIPLEVHDPPVWAKVLVSRMLRTVRLPHTPATVDHFFASLAHEREPLPARGLLVTTVVYLQGRHKGDEVEFTVDPVPRLELAGDLEFATMNLFDQARRIAHRHRDWVRDVLRGGQGHPLNKIKAKRRAQPGAFASSGEHGPNFYDFKAEALAKVNELVDKCQEPGFKDQNTIISEYLDIVYRRVHKRRKDAGLPALAETSWRDQVRPVLQEILAQRLP